MIKQWNKRIFVLIIMFVFASTSFYSSISAMDPELKKQYIRSEDNWFDPLMTKSPACSTATAPPVGGMPADYATSEVKSFASQSIAATWNISDSAAESWFLQQGSVNNKETKGGLIKGVVPRYGLNATNIKEITAAVKEVGVSPVFFYVYTVSEGGGLAGFINHYSRDKELSGGVANAKRDAIYIVEIANSTGHDPAWQDLGTKSGNGDFVPKAIQAAGNEDFKKMPTGTIGRIYLPATAAVAWEVYYPEGLKGSVNGVQDYGKPLKALMNSITKMGGNPMEGGAIVSPDASSSVCTTTGTVTGEGMTKAINWAVMIANNDGYGYDQDKRSSGWAKWQADPNCTTNCGDLDCSSFISAALTVGGYYKTSPDFNTRNQGASLEGIGFTKVASSATTSEGLLPGDILHRTGHTAMYIGNNQIVHASINENGKITGGKPGDQTGKEILVAPFPGGSWSSVWRAPK